MGEDPRQVGEAVETEPRTPEQIEADIERTRRDMGDTVAAVAEKADVKAQARLKVDEAKARVKERVDAAKPDSAGDGAGKVGQRGERAPARAGDRRRRRCSRSCSAARAGGSSHAVRLPADRDRPRHRRRHRRAQGCSTSSGASSTTRRPRTPSTATSTGQVRRGDGRAGRDLPPHPRLRRPPLAARVGGPDRHLARSGGAGARVMAVAEQITPLRQPAVRRRRGARAVGDALVRGRRAYRRARAEKAAEAVKDKRLMEHVTGAAGRCRRRCGAHAPAAAQAEAPPLRTGGAARRHAGRRRGGDRRRPAHARARVRVAARPRQSARARAASTAKAARRATSSANARSVSSNVRWLSELTSAEHADRPLVRSAARRASPSASRARAAAAGARRRARRSREHVVGDLGTSIERPSSSTAARPWSVPSRAGSARAGRRRGGASRGRGGRARRAGGRRSRRRGRARTSRRASAPRARRRAGASARSRGVETSSSPASARKRWRRSAVFASVTSSMMLTASVPPSSSSVALVSSQ